MKHIRIMRRLIQDKSWLRKKYEKLCDQAERWDHFRKFDCDAFFVGAYKAELNYKKYAVAVRRIDRQIKFVKSML